MEAGVVWAALPQRVLLIVVVVLALAAGITMAQVVPGQCEVWAGAPAVCLPYLRLHSSPRDTRYHVFVPEGQTQATLEEAVNTTLSPLLRIAPGDCRKAFTQFVCLSLFSSCSEDTLVVGNTTQTMSRPVCFSVCESVNAWCRDLPRGLALTLDCSPYPRQPPPPVDGPPALPTTTTTNATNHILACFGDGNTPPVVPVPHCPTTFKYSRHDDACMPMCPDAFMAISRGELDTLQTVAVTCGVVGLLFNLLTLPFLLLDKTKRTFPNNALIFICFCLTLWSVAGFMYGHRMETVACADDYTVVENDFYCGALGIWFAQVQGGCVLTWLTCLSLNVFLGVAFPLKPFRKHPALFVAEIIVGFCPFNIWWIIVQAKATRVPVFDAIICSSSPDEDYFFVFTIMATVCWCFTTSMLCASMIGLWRMRLALVDAVDMDATLKVFKETSHMMMFQIIIIGPTTYQLYSLWYIWSQLDSYVKNLEDRAICYASGNSDCSATVLLPLPATIVLFVISQLISVPVFLLVISHPSTRDFWKSEVSTRLSGGSAGSGG